MSARKFPCGHFSEGAVFLLNHGLHYRGGYRCSHCTEEQNRKYMLDPGLFSPQRIVTDGLLPHLEVTSSISTEHSPQQIF